MTLIITSGIYLTMNAINTLINKHHSHDESTDY